MPGDRSRLPRRMGHEPALDGLRALAVAAVVLYHAELTWIPGGFLGVDVFFVVSGFLITALLVQERRTTGGNDLRQFWLRRARRLLPALYALLAVVSVAAVLFARDALATLRSDLVAALTYTTNWWLIFSNQSYFEALGRPSLMRHLWSLAVEEQWYLVWPLVFVGATRAVGGRTRRLLVPVLLAAVASSVWMAVLYVPDTDPSRVYYGTDTRAAGLLIGAALALCWAPWRQPLSTLARPRRALDASGWAAVAALAVICWRANEFSPTLYRGGFLAVAVLSAIAVAASVHPGAVTFQRVFSVPALVWIGVRSYGIYLWHWPVFVLLRPQDVGFDGPPLLALRLSITMVLATVSFRYVEEPVRRGALGRAWKRYRSAPPVAQAALAARWRLATALVVLVAVPVAIVMVREPKYDPLTGSSAAAAEAPDSAAQSVPMSSVGDTSSPTSPAPPADGAQTSAAGDPAPPTTAAPTTAVAGAGAGTVTTAGGAATNPPATAPVDLSGLRLPVTVVAVGDSQARALVANAPKALAGQLTLVNGAVEGCGLVDQGAMRTTARWRRTFGECKGWQAKWERKAAGAKVALVVIGAWDVFDLKLPDSTMTFGSADHDAYLRSQLASGIQGLKRAGAKVALLEIPCYRPVDGGGLVALPERGDDTRTRHLDDLLRAAAAADPQHVGFVTGPTQWCNDPAIAKDLAYRWDGVHYYRPGAALVFDAIAPQLLALAAR